MGCFDRIGARNVTWEEALKILDRREEVGLIHQKCRPGH